jgi:hypothetical protein
MRQAQRFAALQPAEQHPGLKPGFSGEWRGLDLPMQPHDRLVGFCLDR